MSVSDDNSRPAAAMPDAEDKTVVVVSAEPAARPATDDDQARPQARLLGSLLGKRTVALDGTALAQQVHAAVYTRLGSPDGAAELKNAPLAEWGLVTQGRVDERDLVGIYSQVTGLPVADEEELRDLEAFPEVTFDFLAHHLCLPVSWDAKGLLLAVAHPYDVGRMALTWATVFQRDVSFVLARRTLIERNLASLYEAAVADDPLGKGWDANTSEQTLRDLAREAPIVRLVNDMFTRAQEMGASDIHVEPAEEQLAIRYRIDGLLQVVQTPPINQYPAIASRLKLLAGMNIAERRLPQDGRIDLQLGKIELDVRVSTVPSMHGESIVLRLLQKDVTVFDLEKVGLEPDTKSDFERLFNMPHGMLLVVGPTGSGKTTTLYCVMRILNSEDRKIITIEDPVEYQLNGLTQIQVNPKIGLSFANGLRSIVRQDPDVILVGEIRDRETADIAIQAALTGHMVLSTLHTNDAAGAISRLLDMGVESFLISSALLGVVSQRLVRRVCPDCKGTGRPEQDTAEDGRPVHRCRTCLGSGYRGRVGIFEMLVINDDLRHAINERRDSTEIAAIARRHGMRPLREDGELKVQTSVTSAAEVARVCQLDIATD